MNNRILVVEDERDQAELLTSILKKNGYKASYSLDIERAKSKVPEADVVILDYKLGHHTGKELIEWIRENDFPVGIIMITAFGSMDLAVEAVKKGADDFMPKPINPEELIIRLEKLFEKTRILRELEYLKDKISITESLEDFPLE